MPLTFKRYQVLFITALLLLVVSFIPVKRTFDLHLHDTYFVLPHFIIYISLAAFSMITGLVCATAHSIIYSASLSRLHIVLTVTALLFLIVSFYVQTYFLSDHAGFGTGTGRMMAVHRTSQFLSVVFIVLLAAQLLPFINIVLGLFKSRQTGKQA